MIIEIIKRYIGFGRTSASKEARICKPPHGWSQPASMNTMAQMEGILGPLRTSAKIELEAFRLMSRFISWEVSRFEALPDPDPDLFEGTIKPCDCWCAVDLPLQSIDRSGNATFSIERSLSVRF